MAGERILVADRSVAMQEIARNILEAEGYKVVLASNGLAALTYPDLKDVDLLIFDATMEGISGYDATRDIKSDEDLFEKPVLLLIPEEEADQRSSQSLFGADGYVLKPFNSQTIIIKVQALLEARSLRRRSRQFVQDAADRFMQQIADNHIQTAVEKKTQIIVERAIANVVSIIDQRARREVESRVTSLSTEKEQELVKITVHEVAKSMVEKLAERKVTEAMDGILMEQTEKTVKRTADGVLPEMIREKIKDQLEHILPREIQQRVQKAADDVAEQISQNIVTIVDQTAQRQVPKVARERLPEMAQKQLEVIAEQVIPRLVNSIVGREVDKEFAKKLDPVIQDSVVRIKKRVGLINLFVMLMVLIGLIMNVYFGFIAPKLEKQNKTLFGLFQRNPRAAQTPPAPGQ
ncbi:MAG TPA: response regulator [Candidatus Sumerlaeota bacterium]|nr:response regulator [Candidatus Sumerlaeota bacterium]